LAVRLDRQPAAGESPKAHSQTDDGRSLSVAFDWIEIERLQ
jgi:hypothetical protein